MPSDLNSLHNTKSPFDDTVSERHKRMGLLDDFGAVCRINIISMAQLHAGLFYDQLCDTSESYSHVAAVCQSIIDQSKSSSAKQTLLHIALEYDFMCRTLPEAIWWISGSLSILPIFTASFVEHLSILLEKAVNQE